MRPDHVLSQPYLPPRAQEIGGKHHLLLERLDRLPGHVLGGTEGLDAQLLGVLQLVELAGVRVGGADGAELSGADRGIAALRVVWVPPRPGVEDGRLDCLGGGGGDEEDELEARHCLKNLQDDEYDLV